MGDLHQPMMHSTASRRTPQEPDEWFLRGACRSSGLHTDAWFDKNPDAPISKKAKAICRGCPVRARCLHEAYAFPDTAGIWGGLDEYERGQLSRGTHHG